jgi:hypothetical protein
LVAGATPRRSTSSLAAMISRIVISLAVTVSLFAAATCGAEAPPTISDRSLSEVLSLAGLPLGVTTALGRPKSGLDGIADRNKPFNPTDAVDSSLPMRRFIIGGVSETYALVAFERGGIGHSFEAVSYRIVGSTWTETKHWYLSRKPASLLETLKLIDEAAQ